jgi:RNA polymerase sigma factor (sigma-70 family)
MDDSVLGDAAHGQMSRASHRRSRSRSGEHESRPQDRFERLYESYSLDALRLATALTGDRGLAADLVQTAFVRLLARFRDIRNPDSFYYYLRKTIVNLVRDDRKQAARAKDKLMREASMAPVHPSDLLEQLDSRDFLLRLMAALPQKQRTALVLRYFEDLSEAQTADVMGLSISSVKGLTNRAVAALRSEMGDDSGT